MPDEPTPPAGDEKRQEEAARESRDTGGDAPAAASIGEREAVARGDDQLFEGEDADEAGSGDAADQGEQGDPAGG